MTENTDSKPDENIKKTTAVVVHENQMSLIQIDNELIEIIRPEANLEKFASFIFPPIQAIGLNKKRIYSREITKADGEQGTERIEITPSVEGQAYTRRTYDVFLSVMNIWREGGSIKGKFNTSLRKIAENMQVPTNGKWLKIIHQELECLKFNTISFILSFQSDPDKEKLKGNISHQNILITMDYFGLADRASKKDNFKGVCCLEINEALTENLLNQLTIPRNYTALKSIRSSTGKVVYGQVDTILYGKKFYSRTALNTINDCSLDPKKYPYKSHRKQFCINLKKYLHGKRLSDLRILKVRVSETADSTDWRLDYYAETDDSFEMPSKKVNYNPHKKTADEVDYLVNSAIGDVVGGLDENQQLYKKLCFQYSDNLIYRSVSEFKESIQMNPDLGSEGLRLKYFTSIVHRIAHSMGAEWIKDCGENCKHRAENSLFWKV